MIPQPPPPKTTQPSFSRVRLSWLASFKNIQGAHFYSSVCVNDSEKWTFSSKPTSTQNRAALWGNKYLAGLKTQSGNFSDNDFLYREGVMYQFYFWNIHGFALACYQKKKKIGTGQDRLPKEEGASHGWTDKQEEGFTVPSKAGSLSKVVPTGSHLSLEKGVTPFKVSKHPQSAQQSCGPGLKGEASAALAGTNEVMGLWLKTLRSHMLSSYLVSCSLWNWVLFLFSVFQIIITK